MIEHLINYAASLCNVPGWGELDVKGFANLMLVLFVVITLAEILMAIYDRIRESKKEKKVLLPHVKQERIANTNPAMGTH
jgi:hypothetical protein